MDPLTDGQLRLSVFLLEVILAIVLIIWLRLMARGEPPPWGFLFRLLFFGSVAALLAGYIEIRYSLVVDQLAPNHALLEGINNAGASLVEELAKYFVATITIINTRHYHKLSDTILYMIIIGLGFSLVEDALFLINPEVSAPYRLLSFYLHSGTSAIIGYGLTRYKFKLAKYPQLIFSILAAVVLHFTYNWATGLNDGSLSFALTICIALFITLQIFILFRKSIIDEYQMEHKREIRPRLKLLNLE